MSPIKSETPFYCSKTLTVASSKGLLSSNVIEQLVPISEGKRFLDMT